jgi:hypothetical protein
MKRILRVLLAMTLALGVMAGTAAAGTLWYNGDFNGSGNNISNYYEYLYFGGTGPTSYYESYCHVYDDFTVPAGGWTVDSVWSNNRFTSGVVVTGATWEIRSGVSTGNGGTVVQTGSGTPTLTDTGRGTGDYTEYQVLISGLNFHLDPGTYWLSVTPSKDYGDNYSYNSATSGLNAVGQPAGDNGNAYFHSFSHYGNGSESDYYFWNVTNYYGYPVDFSMGIAGEGSPVPLPASLPLLGSGLLGLLGWGYRRRK